MAAWGSLCPRIPTGTPQLPLPVSASDRKLSEHGENTGLPQEMWNHHPWTSLKRPGHGTQSYGLATEEVLDHRFGLNDLRSLCDSVVTSDEDNSSPCHKS